MQEKRLKDMTPEDIERAIFKDMLHLCAERLALIREVAELKQRIKELEDELCRYRKMNSEK